MSGSGPVMIILVHMKKKLAVLPLFCGAIVLAQDTPFRPDPAAGPGPVIVHSKFGGRIYGYDIDQNGTEGLLSENVTQTSGAVLATVETFSQSTGSILDVAAATDTSDNFLTMGVFGTSVGLAQHEHVQGGFVVARTFNTLNPLSGNKLTGTWTPPIGSQHIINPGSISRSQGVPNVAVFAYDNSANFIPYVFSSNVGANTFGPLVDITDSLNFGSVPPPIGLNSVTNIAILGGGDGCFGCFPVIGEVDLTAGTFSEFTGIGFGFVNGLAVDSADNIFCTTTEDDAGVEFYNLTAGTSFKVTLPNTGGQQIYSGTDVEFDPIHKVFLIAQPISSATSSGSSIYVYNTKGHLLETLNGFSFTVTSEVVGTYVALNPASRSGFVNGPQANQLQSFTY